MDARQHAPATERNRQPILEILKQVIAPGSNILEIASGTGEHGVFLASHLRSCRWLPSDINPQARASIVAWKDATKVDNLELPLSIDVMQKNWQEQITADITAIANINMIHISPWAACLGLMSGAEELLKPGGILYLYGPYKRDGKHTSKSNISFDLSLRDRNPQWGIRDLEAVIAAAAAAQLSLQQIVEMPANNLSVIFSR